MTEIESKVAVGFSSNPDSRDAGREVITDAINRLGDEKPDLVLLFSTIHYRKEKYGGMQTLIDGVYDVLSVGTKLVGGTTSGFIIPQGCYTRGVTAMAIKCEDMDFSIAVAENIKKNPELAAYKCAIKIKEDLSKSKFQNKFLLDLPSGTTTPKIPGYPNNLRVVRSKFLSRILLLGTIFSLKVLQKGPGREEVIIEKLAEELPEYQMIGGSLIDDNKGYFNYQFYNNKVYTNMLITLGISTSKQVKVNSTFGLTETDKRFKITKKSTYDLVIEKINNRDAFNEMLEILNWPTRFLSDSARLPFRTLYTPIGYTVNGKRYISVMAFFFGESIIVSPKVRCEDACIMTTSGKKLIESVEENLEETKNKNIQFGLVTSCIARLQTLGRNVYKVHEILQNHFKGNPFLQIYAVGEDVYTKELGAKRIAESYNTAIFYEE